MAPVIRYRIYTEHVASALIARYFDGFTIIRGHESHWKGSKESSVAIEIIGTVADAAKVTTLTRDIREQYRQTEVWITTEEVTLSRVTIDGIHNGFETALRQVS